jgi:GNAT superfamily N-acetyltransferase
MQVSVSPIASRKDLLEFIRLPLALYRRDPCFVPHLLAERKEFFHPQKNPLFEFTEAALFLARGPGGEVLGRISAHINRRHNEFWKERTGFFGFFESTEDLAVARALNAAAEAWLLERGMDRARGPFNFSTNEECGFLSEGFDRLPSLMMTYTKRYYLDFMERLGYAPVKELLAYEFDSGGVEPEYLRRFSQRGQERNGVTIRPLAMRHFEAEVARAFQVYNAAWSDNWGFVPMTEAEFHFAAKNLKLLVDPALALLAEKDGQAIGFALALPDYNPVLQRLRGRLWPLGWLRLLRSKRRLPKVRVLVLGVLEEYRRRGIDVLLYHACFRNGMPLGYTQCECSWILEENRLMRRALERMGAVVTKRYRIYEKAL